MAFTPFLLPLTWVLGLLSLALLGGGLYVIWLWYVGAVVGAVYLVGGCAAVVWTLIGRVLVLSVWRRPGRDEPRRLRSHEVHRIKRPDGTELNVEVSGPPDAPTVVLTHGWGTDSTEWYYTRRALTARFRVITWDLPGLGKSRGPRNGDYRIEKMADDLAAVLDIAGEQPVILMGHSIGGMITLNFWRRFAAEAHRRVAGLVLVNTTYVNPTQTTSFRRLFHSIQGTVLTPLLYLTIWLSPVVWLMNWLGYLNGTTHILTGWTGFAGTESRGQLDFTARFTPLCSPAVVARGALATFMFDERATLPTVGVRTLVVTGDLDRVLIPEASQIISREVPAATLETLQPAGHMGLIEQHARLNEVVEQFSRDCFLEITTSGSSPARCSA
jgi:pimeloyl-ACP methyl ester carboxylesterase